MGLSADIVHTGMTGCSLCEKSVANRFSLSHTHREREKEKAADCGAPLGRKEIYRNRASVDYHIRLIQLYDGVGG